MLINYSDENDKLTSEIWSLIHQAAGVAAEIELGENLSEYGSPAGEIDIEVGVSIVSDDEILDLNREHRGKDSVTDVLSFPQFESRDDITDALLASGNHTTLLGDVVICYEQAMRQAEEYGTGKTREIVYLFVHSLMHLMGYDHEKTSDKKIMRAHEEAVLERIGLER